MWSEHLTWEILCHLHNEMAKLKKSGFKRRGQDIVQTQRGVLGADKKRRMMAAITPSIKDTLLDRSP